MLEEIEEELQRRVHGGMAGIIREEGTQSNYKENRIRGTHMTS